MPVHDLHLVRLQAADEVPAERVAVDGVLRLEVLRAVLADHLDPRLGERPPCRRALTYFVAATIVTSGPTSAADALVALADLSRRQHRSRPATPRVGPAAAVREEQLRVAARAEVEPLDLLDAGRARAPARPPSRGRGSRPASGRRRSAPRPRGRPRSSTARPPARRSPPSRPPPSAATPASTTPAGEPAPARVDDRERRRAVRRARPRSAGSRRSSASIGSPGSSVQSASPRLAACCPARARCTVGVCRCRLTASRAGSSPSAAQARRRFSATRAGSSPRLPRLSEANGPSLTPPSRVVKATTYGPGRVPADHARQQLLGAREQRVAAVERRVVDDLVEQRLERAAELRARAGSRARSGRCRRRRGRRAGAGSPARCSTTARNAPRAARASRDVARPVAALAEQVGLLVVEQVEREPVAVAREQPPRLAARRPRPRSNMWRRTIRTTRSRRSFG